MRFPARPRAPWAIEEGPGPLIAVALHAGHDLRPEVAERVALSDERRLHEEDPHTGRWTEIAPSRVVMHRSRFELDLNRPRDAAVYRRPEDAWGLHVWRGALPPKVVEDSLEIWDRFHVAMHRLITERIRRTGRFLVFDLHSYNHRRGGPDAPPDDPAANPEINVGTGTMERERWEPLIERFLESLESQDFLGRRLDVRENVRFTGGHFSKWIHDSFPATGCALAIEVKKFFMNEWTGEPDLAQIDEVGRALSATIPGVLEELRRAPVYR